MRVRIACDGDKCLRWTEKGRNHNWTVVLTYPLHDNESGGTRRHLCERCADKIERVFQA